MSCTCELGHKCEECLQQQETDTRPLRLFMPGCTHPGTKQGTTCPLCGRVV